MKECTHTYPPDRNEDANKYSYHSIKECIRERGGGSGGVNGCVRRCVMCMKECAHSYPPDRSDDANKYSFTESEFVRS